MVSASPFYKSILIMEILWPRNGEKKKGNCRYLGKNYFK